MNRSLLVLGFGYSSRAIHAEVAARFARTIVTSRGLGKLATLRAEGLDARRFDGTPPDATMREALADSEVWLVSAPPDAAGDPLLGALGTDLGGNRPRRVLYLSTVGVYGDHAGQWVDEATAPRAVSVRSQQRLAAEAGWARAAERFGFGLDILRLSGIYGPGRSAIDALRAGTARRLVKPGQVFNRIHVGDIAGAVAALLDRDPGGLLNVTDSEPAPPQDVVAHAAALLGVPPPPETPFEEAVLSPMARSFYGENKRVANRKLAETIGYRLRCPSYREGLAACLAADQAAFSEPP